MSFDKKQTIYTTHFVLQNSNVLTSQRLVSIKWSYTVQKSCSDAARFLKYLPSFCGH